MSNISNMSNITVHSFGKETEYTSSAELMKILQETSTIDITDEFEEKFKEFKEKHMKDIKLIEEEHARSIMNAEDLYKKSLEKATNDFQHNIDNITIPHLSQQQKFLYIEQIIQDYQRQSPKTLSLPLKYMNEINKIMNNTITRAELKNITSRIHKETLDIV